MLTYIHSPNAYICLALYLYHNNYMEFACVLGLVKLTDVLAFFTGADEIPAGGFTQKPTLSFNSAGVFPTASTCVQQLVLPTQFHDNFFQFKRHLNIAFTCHGGFHLV